jgi:tetratricopeptide (TPR) repeat protein
MAESLRQLGRLAEAATLYHDILDGTPDIGPAHLGLALLLRQQGNRAEATAHFARAATLLPDDPAPWLALADEQRLTGQFNAARGAAHHVLARHPGHLQTLLSLAETERASGAQEEAFNVLRHALGFFPDNPDLLIKLSHCLRALGRLDEARDMYHRTLAAKPDDGWAHVGLGLVFKQQGLPGEAEASFRAALAVLPQDDGLRLDLSSYFLELGKYEDARTLAQEVLTRVPGNLRAMVTLAETNRASGRPEAALAMLESALQLAPRDAGILLQTAHCLRGLGHLDAARAMYHRHLAEQPQNAWAYIGLGQLAKRQGQRAVAEACFDMALALAPEDTALRLDLAAERRDLGLFGLARDMARQILKQTPDNVRALINLADTEREAGQYEDALKIYARARTLHPDDTALLVKMAITARQLERQEECNAYFTAALQIDPYAVAAVRGLAEQYLRADDAQAAMELLQNAAAARPEETEFQFGLLEALAAAGQPQAALAQMEAMEAKLGPHQLILSKRAHTLHNIGRYHEAAAAARQAVSLYPHYFVAWNECFRCERLIATDESLEALLSAAPAVTPQERAIRARNHAALEERRWHYDAALSHYRDAMALTPKDAGLAFDLARIGLLTLNLQETQVQLRRHRDLDAPNLRLRGKSLNTSQTLYGQLLDEYALNEIPPRVLPLLSLPLASRRAPLLALAQSEPDNTAAAIALILCLRQLGELGEINHPGGEPIPKLIFQFWDTAAIPEDILAYRASWQTQNPDYVVHAFDDAKALKFLQSVFPPAVAQAYAQAQEPAQKADIFRLAALFAYGGVYADADDRCQRPLDQLVPPNASLVLYQEDLGSIGNNFIAAAPRHPLIHKALQFCVQAAIRGDSDIAWLATGPGMLTRAFTQVFASGAQDLPGQTLVLGLQGLCPTVAIHCLSGYKSTKKHWTNSSFTRKRNSFHVVPGGLATPPPSDAS